MVGTSVDAVDVALPLRFIVGMIPISTTITEAVPRLKSNKTGDDGDDDDDDDDDEDCNHGEVNSHNNCGDHDSYGVNSTYQ